MNPKFLMVDDDQDALNVLGAILGALGCGTEAHLSGSKALEVLRDPQRASEFDALFLDIMMPEMNGIELLSKIRELPHAQAIPVVFLTSLAEGETIIEGYRQGATYYITKPFTQEQVVYGLDLLFSEEEVPLDPDQKKPARVHLLEEA